MPLPRNVRVGVDGAEVSALAGTLTGGRWILGLTGCPGAGKSTLAAALAQILGDRSVVVPMDGFHLADRELDRQGVRERKGAPETFDPSGYAALLRRLRAHPADTVYAPGFDRSFEQPVAGAIAVAAAVSGVITEGNYLLLDQPQWHQVRAQLDEVWFVFTDDSLRVERLVARHVRSGKSPESARDWVARVDEPNARLVEASRAAADRQLDVTAWDGRPGRRGAMCLV